MAKGLRILVLNERDPEHPKAGGAEVHVAEIARRLAARGHSITQLACSFAGAARDVQVAGMRVLRLGPLPLYYPRAALHTRRATRRGDYDVVVEHLCKLPFASPLYARAPVLAVNHHLFGFSAFLQVAWPIAAAVVASEWLAIPRAYRGARFLAVSESSREDLVRRGVARERIGILHNGIQPPRCEPVPYAQRPARIAYLGRLEPYKRVEVLLGAFAELRAGRPELELLVIGRGSERERLEALARRLGIAERVRFSGFVDDAERDALLASARICVCPSVKEGWGITVIEANALGVPVVATDAPGLRDAVRHGETGVLVPDAEPALFQRALAAALRELLADPERGARLAAAAREWSRDFDWDHSADAMEAELYELIARTRPGEPH